ncbi:MAG: hypothetical protein M3R59_11530 [Verrucomicrobiota bacterium]|nr:hypothetical protein [Verrucomicrobiota bacterium]
MNTKALLCLLFAVLLTGCATQAPDGVYRDRSPYLDSEQREQTRSQMAEHPGEF